MGDDVEAATGERDPGGTDANFRRRRLAGGLAVALAIAIVALELRYAMDAVTGEGMPGRLAFLPVALAEAAPWLIGAMLLQRRRIRLATAVLITSAVLLVVPLLPVMVVALTGMEPGFGINDLIARVAFAVMAATIARLVWSSRVGLAPEPRRPVPRFVWVAAGLVALSAAFFTVVSRQMLRGESLTGWFVTTLEAGQFGNLSSASWTVIPALLALGVAAASYRIGGDVAGAVLLTFAGPALLVEVNTQVVNITVFDGMTTPAGGVVLIGLVGMIVAGLQLLGPIAEERPARPVGPAPMTPASAGD